MLTPERKADLSQAAGYSFGQLKVFRENRKAAVKQYVGTHYSDNGAAYKVPIPMIELAVNVYLQLLVASCPRVAINTGVMQLREIVERFKLALNHLITDEIDLEDTLESAVIGAIFCMGVVKVGINHTQVEYLGAMHDAGQPFADYVNLDNFLFDMTTDNRKQCQFMADKYPIAVEDAKKMFSEEVHKHFSGSSQAFADTDTVHGITDNSGLRKEYNETMLVWDCYLPRENMIHFFMDSGDPTNPFGEEIGSQEWYGVETGPYHILGFNKVEGNSMPLAPVALFMDLDALINKLYRKLGRQAERQKTNTFVNSPKDGNRLKTANDGDILPVDNADKINDHKTGGIDPTNLAFMIQSKDLLDYIAGNLSSLGGLSPQSDTLGQDNLLSAGASQRIKRMNKKVYKFVQGICKALAFYLWNDPYINIPVVKRIPGLDDIQVRTSFGRNDVRNENDFMEYNITIEPYSLQHQGPEAKLQTLRTIFGEMIAPMLPTMAQLGIGFDFEKFLRTISELANLPELDNMLVYADPKHAPQAVGEAPQKAQNTTRNYVRTNRPGATQPGKDQIMMQTLLGGRPQNSEMASLGRATG
jgi:hypothetical protein